VSDLRKVTELTCIVMSCFSCFTIVPKSTGLAKPSDNQPVGVNLMPTFEHSERGQSKLEHKYTSVTSMYHAQLCSQFIILSFGNLRRYFGGVC